MHTRITLQTLYHCPLEQAFKTPMLCDVSKIHTGLLFMPKVTHCTEDENWGKPGSMKKVFVGKSIAFSGGEASTDQVIERMENKYWKIEVGNFKMQMLGFTKFTGEWETTEIAPENIRVRYTYTLHCSNKWLYPLNWLFTEFYWRYYMKQVLRNIGKMIEAKEPYLFA